MDSVTRRRLLNFSRRWGLGGDEVMETVLGCKNSTGMGGNGETFHGDGVGMGQFILLVQLLTSDAI